MKITHTEIFHLSIPMVPFTIATGTMRVTQNLYIKMYTDEGIVGVGECSAFPMIAGETQNTCFEMAKEFAALLKNQNPLAIQNCLALLDAFTAGNYTAKSAFDMALYDIAAQHAQQPLYAFLGGSIKPIESDLTIGIDTPKAMAEKAVQFVQDGVRMIKVKLGKNATEDVERIKAIRSAIGNSIVLRIDANQGWTFDEASYALSALYDYDIQFCEQPMRKWNDHLLPQLMQQIKIPIMADESVFTHYDAERILRNKSCDYINIKFAKSGGIAEAERINQVAASYKIPCMLGGMLESRVALTAKVHFAMSHENVVFYDLDTCKLGHKVDPVFGGVEFDGMHLKLDDTVHGIGASVDEDFLKNMPQISI